MANDQAVSLRALQAVFGVHGRNVKFYHRRSELQPERFLEIELVSNLPVGQTDELKIFLTRLHPYLVVDFETGKIHEGDSHLEHNLGKGEKVKALATLSKQ